jgi:hypothetical protein
MTSNRAADAPWHRAVTAVCFVLPLGVYLSTAARTVQGGDAGEFGLIGILGGVAHPPGYPTYSLLARVAGALPFGQPYFRVAALSALCGATSVAVLQRAAWAFSGSLAGSAAAALVFAFSPLPWRLSGVPEVFALNDLAAATLILVTLRGAQPLVVGLVCGLGLTNHLSLIWCAPLILGWLVDAPREQWLPRAAGWIAGTAVGLLPYLLLPLLAMTSFPGALVWGETTTLRGFFDHVLRREYGTFRLAPGADATLLHLAPIQSFLEALPGQLAWIPFGLALFGLFLARRAKGTRPLLAAFALSGLFFIALFNTTMARYLAVAVEERFYLLPMLLLVPFLAVGAGWSLGRVPKIGQVGLVGALALTLIVARFDGANWKRETAIEDFTRGALESLPPHSVVLGSGDTWLSATRWVSEAEKIRPDVRYVDINIASMRWYAGGIQRDIPELQPAALLKVPWKVVLSIAATERPTYVLIWDGIDHSEIQTTPSGFLDRVVKPNTAPRPLATLEAELARATDALHSFEGAPVDVHSALVRRLAANRWVDLANGYAATGDVAAAERCRRRAAVLAPD